MFNFHYQNVSYLPELNIMHHVSSKVIKTESSGCIFRDGFGIPFRQILQLC